MRWHGTEFVCLTLYEGCKKESRRTLFHDVDAVDFRRWREQRATVVDAVDVDRERFR